VKKGSRHERLDRPLARPPDGVRRRPTHAMRIATFRPAASGSVCAGSELHARGGPKEAMAALNAHSDAPRTVIVQASCHGTGQHAQWWTPSRRTPQRHRGWGDTSMRNSAKAERAALQRAGVRGVAFPISVKIRRRERSAVFHRVIEPHQVARRMSCCISTRPTLSRRADDRRRGAVVIDLWGERTRQAGRAGRRFQGLAPN